MQDDTCKTAHPIALLAEWFRCRSQSFKVRTGNTILIRCFGLKAISYEKRK